MGPVVGLMVPLVVSSTVCVFSSRFLTVVTALPTRKRWIVTSLAVLPFVFRVVTHSRYRLVDKELDLFSFPAQKLIANTAGKAALMAIGPLLVAPSLVWIHTALGVLVCVIGLGHSISYLYRFYILRDSVMGMLFPPWTCWLGKTNEACDDKHCDCYHLFVNFYGLVAFFCILTIGITSLHWFRRRSYAIFYKMHMITGPLFLLALVMHYKRSMTYIGGGLLVYMSTLLPGFFERQYAKPVQIVAMDRIDCPGSRPCLAVTITMTHTRLFHGAIGQYVKLSAPTLSNVSHPFSVVRIDGNGQLKLLLRCSGNFTKRLSHDLCQSGPMDRPPIYLDGFHGCPHRLFDQVKRHDTLVFVVGGVGITAFLGLLETIPASKSCIVHWACRDQTLIEYVETNYLPLVAECVQIFVYHTGNTTVTADSMEGQERSIESIDYTKSTGEPFCPSLFSSSGPKLWGRVAPLGVAMLIMGWVGMIVLLLSYNYLQVKGSMRSRLWTPSITLLYGILAAYVLQKCFQYSKTVVIAGNQVHNDDESLVSLRNDNPQEMLSSREDHEGNTTEVEMAKLHSHHTSKKLLFGAHADTKTMVEHRHGRPTMVEIMAGLPDTGCSIGFFLCGPASLSQHVNQYLLGGLCPARKYELYEESFER